MLTASCLVTAPCKECSIYFNIIFHHFHYIIYNIQTHISLLLGNMYLRRMVTHFSFMKKENYYNDGFWHSHNCSLELGSCETSSTFLTFG